MSAQILDFKQAKVQREREPSKRQALVKQIAVVQLRDRVSLREQVIQRVVDKHPQHRDMIQRVADEHPEWGPEELALLHRHLEAWGE